MSNKEQKELAITIGLVLVFAIVLATSLKPKKKRRHRPAKAQAPAATNAATALPPPPLATASSKRALRANSDVLEKQKARLKLDWGRDPFFSSYSSVSLKGGNLSLKGISFSQNKPAALINTEVVFVGDKIGKAKVIDIEKDKVLLEESGRKFILRLEEK